MKNGLYMVEVFADYGAPAGSTNIEQPEKGTAFLMDNDGIAFVRLRRVRIAAKHKKNGPPPCGLRWIDDYGSSKCPVCGYSCNDEYYLGKGNFCPDCGTRLLGLRNIMEGNP